MVKLHRWHRRLGLSAGAVLFLLGLTGFFLDHDQWRFLYTLRLPFSNHALEHAENRLFESYHIYKGNGPETVVCGKRGIFARRDGSSSYSLVLDRTCNALAQQNGTLYAATDDGIYTKNAKSGWKRLALAEKWVNAMALHGDRLFAAVDKSGLYLLDAKSGAILEKGSVHLNPDELGFPIKLSRFVRDLHYGRGLFEAPWSLWINDYGAWILLWLTIGGLVIWWRIKHKSGGKSTRRWIRWHANLWSVAAIVPLSILAITGLFLDHAGTLSGFMRSVTIPSVLLPPVYRSLQHDIWSVDYDGATYRIGNRYGIYISSDMRKWRLENRGFAYRLVRHHGTLYVSGMGAPNRILESQGYRPLPHTPHMFKSIVETTEGYPLFFSPHNPGVALPHFNDATLYSLLLTIHDGTFFAEWWKWVDDYAAVALLLLLATGVIRWWRKRFH
ncbi:PepSY-associated TM helix domain-containing protein [Hydrogenimonas urashimensis]|uniref:PepSY-associated TM helix domain-containing protein n=1 Tax=Hydrogenimonas urashimensis TaxID=2740515 RepID=UPI001916A628|nr:PepSY-associated TM helix domain-containing protein [Hydrogenimonas urashimensis]